MNSVYNTILNEALTRLQDPLDMKLFMEDSYEYLMLLMREVDLRIQKEQKSLFEHNKDDESEIELTDDLGQEEIFQMISEIRGIVALRMPSMKIKENKNILKQSVEKEQKNTKALKSALRGFVRQRKLG